MKMASHVQHKQANERTTSIMPKHTFSNVTKQSYNSLRNGATLEFVYQVPVCE